MLLRKSLYASLACIARRKSNAICMFRKHVPRTIHRHSQAFDVCVWLSECTLSLQVNGITMTSVVDSRREKRRLALIGSMQIYYFMKLVGVCDPPDVCGICGVKKNYERKKGKKTSAIALPCLFFCCRRLCTKGTYKCALNLIILRINMRLVSRILCTTNQFPCVIV